MWSISQGKEHLKARYISDINNQLTAVVSLLNKYCLYVCTGETVTIVNNYQEYLYMIL